MKKIVYGMGIVLIAVCSVTVPVFAQLGPPDPEPGGEDSPIQSTQDVVNIITNIAELVFQLFFIVAVLFILFAAYMYLTAGDNTSKVDKAKTSLKNAVIAIVIALISTGVATIIDTFLRNNN